MTSLAATSRGMPSSFGPFHAFVQHIFSSDFRLLNLLDKLDTQVEHFRKEVLLQQDKKDAYLMSLEVIKNSEMMTTLDECKYTNTYHALSLAITAKRAAQG